MWKWPEDEQQQQQSSLSSDRSKRLRESVRASFRIRMKNVSCKTHKLYWCLDFELVITGVEERCLRWNLHQTYTGTTEWKLEIFLKSHCHWNTLSACSLNFDRDVFELISPIHGLLLDVMWFLPARYRKSSLPCLQYNTYSIYMIHACLNSHSRKSNQKPLLSLYDGAHSKIYNSYLLTHSSLYWWRAGGLYGCRFMSIVSLYTQSILLIFQQTAFFAF